MWRTEISEIRNVKSSIEDLWVRGMKIKSLEFLLGFPTLKRLFLSSIKTQDLTPIGSLLGLSELEMTNVGNGGSLDAISRLENLRTLRLQTPPGWDGSGKTIKYRSLEPLIKLKNLKELALLDVVFDFDGLAPLLRLESLTRLKVTNRFCTQDFATIAKHRPELECDFARPYKTFEGTEYFRCSKCGQMKVEFSGVDLSRRVYCLNCNEAKCRELIDRFNKIKNDA